MASATIQMQNTSKKWSRKTAAHFGKKNDHGTKHNITVDPEGNKELEISAILVPESSLQCSRYPTDQRADPKETGRSDTPMNRAHRSQLREILLQLTDLKNRLNAIYWDSGEDASIHEGTQIKRALEKLNGAINELTGVI